MGYSLNNSWRFGLLLAVILLGGIGVNAWEYGDEAKVQRSELKNFPKNVASWEQIGADERFDAATEGVLRADDYLLRNYRMGDGKVASFYVGYYATQRNGATYHSPLNCLPGNGWSMSEPALMLIKPVDGRPAFEANRYLIQSGRDKQLMIYWYQGRGRAVASEYWGKIYTVVDSLRRRRSDGSMVRITVPVADSESAAIETAGRFAADVSTVLPAYVPD
ncbi:MAG: EpsI family protein [Acidobacteria bacterium]|nr:EpsI family protein [Acidobacteriota bacterium]